MPWFPTSVTWAVSSGQRAGSSLSASRNIPSYGPAIESAVLLAVVSAGVFVCRRRAPYLLVGWLWYLGMLVPVIGLLQVGGQSMADRYTYLPLIGLSLGLVWAVADLTNLLVLNAHWAVRRASCLVLALASAGIIAALVVGAWQQTAYWRDSETLWGRDMLYPNTVAHYNLGSGAGGFPTSTSRGGNRTFQIGISIFAG